MEVNGLIQQSRNEFVYDPDCKNSQLRNPTIHEDEKIKTEVLFEQDIITKQTRKMGVLEELFIYKYEQDLSTTQKSAALLTFLKIARE